MSRSRGWCFTVNNWSTKDCAVLITLFDDPNVTYLICGFEKGKSGTSHIQGYFYCTDAVSFKTAVKLLPEGAHIESQKASKNVEAYCYCMEDGDYCEFGERPRQGHRTDLEVIKHDILKKKPMLDVADKYFSQWCQYRRSFDEYARLKVKHDTQLVVYDEKTNVLIYQDYPYNESYIFDSLWFSRMQIINMKNTGRYKYIFIPNTCGIEQYEDLVDKTLF